MNANNIVVFGVLALGASCSSYAGNCTDAWVTKAITEVTGHAPSGSANSGDCNIQNYGNGHWSSYADLVAKVRAGQAPAAATVAAPAQQAGVCGDAWVTRAVKEVTGRAPNGSGSSGECSIQRYGNGSWSSYADLVTKVRAANGMTLAQPAAPARPAPPVIGTSLGANVIPPTGAGNVANNTTRLINDGGAYVKPPNLAGLVTDNGSGVVSHNGGDVVRNNTAGAISPNGAGLTHRSLMSVPGGASGKCTDPWVTQAINEVKGRAPNGSGNSGECAISNYGGGHWSSYADLVAKVRAGQPQAAAPVAAPAQQAGVCGDEWVTRAVKEVTGHAPNGSGSSGECSIQRYGNGSWSSYPDLVAKVRAAISPLITKDGGSLAAAKGNPIIQDGAGIAAAKGNLIGQDGAGIAAAKGNLIGQDGGSVAQRTLMSVPGSANGTCSDAWVTKAIHEVKGRAPNGSGNSGECAISNYGGGHWSSYADLVSKVRAAGSGSASGPEYKIYSDDAVRHGEGVYTTKRYPEAERALQCAGFTNNFAPTRPSRNVVPGKDYEVIPRPAVKHAADVDLRAHVNGGGLCSYIKEQPQVRQWYQDNFGLSSPQAAAPSAATAGFPQAANAQVANAQTTGGSTAAPNKTSQDPRVLSCAITVSGKINAFKPKYEQALRDLKISATQKVAIDALVEKEKELIREVKERKNVTLEQCTSADKNVTDADKLLATALASSGQSASR